MANYFFDSSALVKRYVTETGSSWVMRQVSPQRNNQIYIASITAVEIVAALTRRGRSSQPAAALPQSSLRQFHSDLRSAYIVVGLTGRMIRRAMETAQSHALRGYDAVQLAAAVMLNSELQTAHLSALTLVSADNELNKAAQIENLAVENPNDHP